MLCVSNWCFIKMKANKTHAVNPVSSSSALPRTRLSRCGESLRKHGPLMPYFPPVTTMELQHPSVQPRRRSGLTNTGRGISTRPLTQDNQLTQTWGQTGAVCVCVWARMRVRVGTDWLCPTYMFYVFVMIEDRGCVCVYVPTIHPQKQTMIERTVLFIRSSRRATCSSGQGQRKGHLGFKYSLFLPAEPLTGIMLNQINKNQGAVLHLIWQIK